MAANDLLAQSVCYFFYFEQISLSLVMMKMASCLGFLKQSKIPII